MNPIAVILIICIAGLGCWFLSGIIEWYISGRKPDDTDPDTLDG